jgi:cytochrome P450 family 142 subfamily A polypeptide 1
VVEPGPPVDLLSGGFYAQARPAYAWMRAHEPVFRDEANGLWAFASHELVQSAGRDPATFANAGGSRPDTGPLPWMIDLDGPAHRTRRRLVSGAFTPAQVRGRRPAIEAICDQLIDAVCEQGSCDVVRAIAAPLPMIVIGDMLGVEPADRGRLLAWSDDLLATLSGDPGRIDRAAAAFAEYSDYATRTIRARRTAPADDLFSVLVQAEIDGEGLSDDELVFESLLILVGGDETTRHVISGGLEQLLSDPAILEDLRSDVDVIPAAVEEMLRWVSPIKSMNRTLTRDIERHGHRLREGEKVLLLYESANFDEARFAEPERFDVARSPNDHVAFGYGPHHCLGAGLARLEVQVAVERVLARLPDMALAGEVERDAMGSITSLPVTFTPSARRG